MNGKMLGRLGWRGQCSCCNGSRTTGQLRAEEKRQAAAEAREAVEGGWRPDLIGMGG